MRYPSRYSSTTEMSGFGKPTRVFHEGRRGLARWVPDILARPLRLEIRAQKRAVYRSKELMIPLHHASPAAIYGTAPCRITEGTLFNTLSAGDKARQPLSGMRAIEGRRRKASCAAGEGAGKELWSLSRSSGGRSVFVVVSSKRPGTVIFDSISRARAVCRFQNKERVFSPTKHFIIQHHTAQYQCHPFSLVCFTSDSIGIPLFSSTNVSFALH